MDSTPPSLRSNPRIKNTLIKSPIPSLELVLSSPKSNDTLSPDSLNSPSSPLITLREILLLSPSPIRKSRTRLADRFDVDPAEARRCKTKGGQYGLLASPSPRSCRRSNKLTKMVVETKQFNDQTPKPKKHSKTPRSKKEKHISVPLLPSPSPSSDLSRSTISQSDRGDVFQGDLEKIRENFNDLIMWKDIAKSTLWFGFGCLCFLSSCFTKRYNISVFSVASHLGLLFLGASFLSKTLRQRVTEEAAGRELKLSEESVLRIARRILPFINLVISKLNRLFSGEPAMTLKVAPLVLIGAEFGYLITFWRLCAFGFFLSFTVPKLYSCYASQINQKVESAQKRIVEAWGICTHKKLVAGSAVTAYWNLTSLKTRFFTVFIIVVVIRYRRQNLQLDSEEEEQHQEQTHLEQQESPEEEAKHQEHLEEQQESPEEEEEQTLWVVPETVAPKKL